jgi:signal transduction histidine kinase
MKEDLGIKSVIVTPLQVGSERRGVLLVSSSAPDFFTKQDLHFLEAVVRWVGVVIHRAELVEQHTSEMIERARQLAAEEMLTVMAHDLRNYLTPLKGRLDLLERRARREEQEAYVRELVVAKQTLRRLDYLLSDLLDVERLKQGIFSLNFQSVDLVKLLEELVLIWSIPEHSIQVQAPRELLITADRDRIQQVLENLLANALTHADPGTPIQVVMTQEQREGGPWAIITVSNRGPEIPPELLVSLFQPFAKGAHSKGLGLGLCLAQRIAHAHQGTLTVHTEAGTGTHFTLTLPVHAIQPTSEALS